MDLTPNDYSVELSIRFEFLARLDEEKTPNELWADIKVTLIEVGKQLVPKIKKRKQKWITPEAYNLIVEGECLKQRDWIAVMCKKDTKNKIDKFRKR